MPEQQAEQQAEIDGGDRGDLLVADEQIAEHHQPTGGQDGDERQRRSSQLLRRRLAEVQASIMAPVEDGEDARGKPTGSRCRTSAGC
ncbi:MAG: hypothetical protein U0736_18160 [Gemmataceae bacterium]